MSAALEVQGLTTRFDTRRGCRHGRQRRELFRRARAHHGPRRRKRLGQIRHRLLHSRPDRRARARSPSGRSLVEARTCAASRRTSCARMRGRKVVDGLPGPDDDAEPGAAHRRPDGDGRARARADDQGQGAGRARATRSGSSASRRRAERLARLSAPAFGRDAPARRHRDRAAAPARGHHRGRADDRARRVDPGPDPGRGAPAGGRDAAPRSSGSPTTLPSSPSLADDICVMYAGRIVERGTAEEVIGQPRHPYTRGLLDSVPAPASAGRAPAADPRLDAATVAPALGLPVPHPLPARDRDLPDRSAAGTLRRSARPVPPPAGGRHDRCRF